MEALTIIPDVSGKWSDLADKPETEWTGHLSRFEIGGLAEATVKGKPGVAIRVDAVFPDGTRTVVAQTTLALFLSAADALKAKHGDPREEES